MGAALTYRDRRLLNAVRDFACQWCGRDDGTIVAAHSNEGIAGKGMGMKASDALVAALCDQCHREVDQSSFLTRRERQEMWRTAFVRTQPLLEGAGVVTEEVRQEWDGYMRRVCG